jgi:hypothetical protein
MIAEFVKGIDSFLAYYVTESLGLALRMSSRFTVIPGRARTYTSA